MTARGGGPIDVGSMSGGAHTGRVPVDDLSAEQRAQKQAQARGNMAALVLTRHGLDPRRITTADIPPAVKEELRELAQAMGIDGRPVRKPGHCACGAVLPMGAATSSAKFETRNGQCRRCSSGHPPAQPEDNARSVVADSSPTVYRVPAAMTDNTGRCGSCDRRYRLDSLGRLPAHPGWAVRRGVLVRLSTDCRGSRRTPEDSGD